MLYFYSLNILKKKNCVIITKILYNYNLYLYKILLYVKKYLIMYNINGEEKI